jgi:hypothetical protein
VQQQARVEALAAARLTTAWHRRYYATAEQRADLIASYFLVPQDGAETVARDIFTSLPMTATTYEYLWLRRLEEEVLHVIKAAETMRERMAPAPYNPYAPLFERVA